MARITNRHLEAVAGTELRDFGYPKVANAAALPTLTADHVGTIYTTEDDGANHRMAAVNDWVKWHGHTTTYVANGATGLVEINSTVVVESGGTVTLPPGTEAGTVWAMPPGGQAWSEVTPPSFDPGTGVLISGGDYPGGLLLFTRLEGETVWHVQNTMVQPTSLAAPTFTVQPADATFFVGAPGTIRYTTTDATTWTVYSGLPGDTSTPVGTGTASGITDPDWQPADAGTFWIRATGPGGTADSTGFTATVEDTITATLAATNAAALSVGNMVVTGGAITVDWGDGTVEPLTLGSTHNYAPNYTGDVTFTLDTGERATLVALTGSAWTPSTDSISALAGGLPLTRLGLLGTGATGDVAALPPITEAFTASNTALTGALSSMTLTGLNGDLQINNTAITGTTADVPSTILGRVDIGDTGFGGDVIDLPRNMLLGLTISNSLVTGAVIDLPRSVAGALAMLNTAVAGPLADMPPNVIGTLTLQGSPISGDMADLPTGIDRALMHNTLISDYSGGGVPALLRFEFDAFAPGGLSQPEIDLLLADMDAAGAPATAIVELSGSNQAPSAAGEASITSLRGKGWTVTVTGGF